MAIPDFSLLRRNYPDYEKFPQPAEVRKMIGGEANDSDITNTCTIRMCQAMNEVGFPIPLLWDGVTNRRGKNGKYYIIRVVNFRPWMLAKFGKPDLDFPKEAGKKFDRAALKGREGIIGFEIGGFNDATGHFDLWYQDKFTHESSAGKDYFTMAARISLWSTGITWSEASV